MASCTIPVPYAAAVGSSANEGSIPREPDAQSKRQKFSVTIDDLRFDNTVFVFLSPLCVMFSMEEDAWYCSDEAEHIVSRGDCPERALHSFAEDFAVLWDEIANARDEDLTLDAQALKGFLRSSVRDVKKG